MSEVSIIVQNASFALPSLSWYVYNSLFLMYRIKEQERMIFFHDFREKGVFSIQPEIPKVTKRRHTVREIQVDFRTICACFESSEILD